ncbi:PilZ domain-containing protein [Corallococcus exiguus]|uniref:PilZ domain-containing protein n=1 Tax=Corallococcus exiguus TaxID=83462 RepID=UPI00155F84EF|nr:PilZ domain-containing protein [Corallococcus exiguus]NRD54309.1 PilZ domain-containing protein [Corallococcus exiguus]
MVVQRKGVTTAKAGTAVRGPEDTQAPRPLVPPVGTSRNVPLPGAVPRIEMNQGEPEHRHFPRAQLATHFDLWMEDDAGGRRFSAGLTSVNVSVSGAFLASTFFLPMGSVVRARFALEEGAAPVEARAEIVREERGPEEQGRSGFALRFLDFSGQTEVALARLFLGMRLRAFTEDYLKSQRARSLPNELERVIDVMAAWELLKATTPGDPWRGE